MERCWCHRHPGPFSKKKQYRENDQSKEVSDLDASFAYGQHYQINNEWHLVETHIDILPYDEQRNFLNIIPEIDAVHTIN